MKSTIKILRYFILMIYFTNVLNVTVKEVRAAIKELIFSYYMRGKFIQIGPKEYYYPQKKLQVII